MGSPLPMPPIERIVQLLLTNKTDVEAHANCRSFQ